MSAEPRRQQMRRYVVPADDKAHEIASVTPPFHVAATRFLGRECVEFWALWNDGVPEVARTYQVYGTGHDVPSGAIWSGTANRTPDGFVWHLFELRKAGEGDE